MATGLVALLCATVWAQQQPSRPGMGQRTPLQPRQENVQRQQPDVKVITISFDVQLPDSLSKENLSFQFSDGSWVEYDPESGLYTTEIVLWSSEPYECTYRVDYRDYEKDIEYFPKWGTFTADATQTITVDMTHYHAASFACSDPDNWMLQNFSVRLQTDAPWADEARESLYDLSEPLYLEPGQYAMEAVICSTDGNYTHYYGTPAQAFTMGAADATFTFQVDPQRYHSVTIAATDREGKPLTSGSVSLTSSTGYCASYGRGLGDDGTITTMLHEGQYHYEIEDNNQLYCSGDFTVAGNDTTIRAAMSSDWLRLRVRAEGDLVSYFAADEWASQSVYLTNTDDWSGTSVYLRKDGDALALPEGDPLYLKAGEYEYRVDWDKDGYRVKEEGRFRLEGDQKLVIDLSSDRYATVTFPVYDPDGNPVSDAAETLYLTDPFLDTELFYGESPLTTFFLLPGTYNARYEDDIYGVFNIPFTVEAGQQAEVPIRLERRDYATVRVRLQLPQGALADYYYMYGMDYCTLNFGQGGVFDRDYYAAVPVDVETGVGEGEVALPVGQYEYAWEPASLRHQGTLDLQGDTLLTFDLTQTPYLQILLTDEAGQPLDFNQIEAACAVYQNPQEMMVGYYGFFGFLEPGTYQVYVSAYFYDEETDTDLNTTVARTITMGTESQVLTIAVPDPNPDLFSVYFDFVDGAEYIYRSGTLSMNGQTSPVIEGSTYMSGIPAGTYTYTAQVDGYEPYTGTLEVNDQAVAYDKTIEVTVPLTRQEPVTGIGQVAAGDEAFHLFPTVATDALHILPAAATDSEWTVRITSFQGMTVYNDRHVLDAEAVLPVGHLAPGLYLLTLNNGTEVQTYKFVKR